MTRLMGSMTMPQVNVEPPAFIQSMWKPNALTAGSDSMDSQSASTNQKMMKPTAIVPVAAMADQLGKRRPAVARKKKAIAGSAGISQAHSITGCDQYESLGS